MSYKPCFNCIGVELISKGLLIYRERGIKLEYTASASKCCQQVTLLQASLWKDV